MTMHMSYAEMLWQNSCAGYGCICKHGGLLKKKEAGFVGEYGWMNTVLHDKQHIRLHMHIYIIRVKTRTVTMSVDQEIRYIYIYIYIYAYVYICGNVN